MLSIRKNIRAKLSVQQQVYVKEYEVYFTLTDGETYFVLEGKFCDIIIIIFNKLSFCKRKQTIALLFVQLLLRAICNVASKCFGCYIAIKSELK